MRRRLRRMSVEFPRGGRCPELPVHTNERSVWRHLGRWRVTRSPSIEHNHLGQLKFSTFSKEGHQFRHPVGVYAGTHASESSVDDILRMQIAKTFSDIRKLEERSSQLRRVKQRRDREGAHQYYAIYTFLGRGVFYNILIRYLVKHDLVWVHRDTEDSDDVLMIQPPPKRNLVTKFLRHPVSTRPDSRKWSFVGSPSLWNPDQQLMVSAKP